MCGISGFIGLGIERRTEVLLSTVRNMADRLEHRGPDDSGVWVDAQVGLALGHRRLSIIDVSSRGRQPMESSCGRFVITYNGEIYNFLALRKELESTGHRFRGHSDTEVLIETIAAQGVELAVRQCHGMWAFALWDRQSRTLALSRDRIGKKPLYYGWTGKDFLFASELKAFHAHPGFQRNIDRDAVALLLKYGYVPSPYSIYRGVWKLPPAVVLTMSATTLERGGDYTDIARNIRPYWSARAVAEEGIKAPVHLEAHEAVQHLDRVLSQSVARRMIADVPLGAMLSGGIDSSAVVALMQKQSATPIRTFSIGFHEPGYNEAHDAKAVASHLKTEHTELYVTPREAMAVIPKLPILYDEPFADYSQIPTYLLSELARKHVTVCLSGDGGDEVLGGYNRYVWGMDLWNRMRVIPKGVRRGIGTLLNGLSSDRVDATVSFLNRFLPKRARQVGAGDKLHKAAAILQAESLDDMYHGFVSRWSDPASVVLGSTEPHTVLTDTDQWAHLGHFAETMMFLDQVTYLPEDILVKVDRASMGVGLEVRAPLLDDRVVEFAWRIPLSMKIRDGKGKWLLRQVVQQYVPEALIERPKMGFGIPIDTWIRGPLRDWAEDLFDVTRLRQGGFFDPVAVREKWEEHCAGRRNWQHALWSVLMFQGWYEANRN